MSYVPYSVCAAALLAIHLDKMEILCYVLFALLLFVRHRKFVSISLLNVRVGYIRTRGNGQLLPLPHLGPGAEPW